MASHGDWSEQFKYSNFKRAGDLIYCSGQVGLDEAGNAPTDPAEQYRLAFDALAAVLSTAGCTPDNLVDLMSYHTSYPEHMAEFMAAKATFQGEARPTWTAVGVEKLGMPDTLVEIKAIAQSPR